jgi:outer membrane lipoprotein SlyB
MANFTPIRPNYYTRSNATGTTNATSGIQQSGIVSAVNTNTGTTRANRSRSMPGLNNNLNSTINENNLGYVPNVNLNAVVNGPVAGAIGGALVGGAIGGAIGGSTGAAIGAVVGAAASYYNPGVLNPTLNRLAISGLPQAGVYTTGIDSYVPTPDYTSDVYASFTDSYEDRVIISDQTGQFIGTTATFKPLQATGGVVFPYTPIIGLTHRAQYEMEGLLQTNYTMPYYTKSSVDSISIQGRFTAQNESDANYVLAMINFFRTATKMFYGKSNLTGTPPPVLYLDAYGKNLFDHIPIVISEFQYSMPNDCHYITTKSYKGNQLNKVPVDLNITLTAIPTYSRNNISNNFSLNKFANGDLLSAKGGKGGWI